MSSDPPLGQTKPVYTDKPLIGMALYALAVLLIVTMNGFAKKASLYYAPVELLFYRGLIALAVVLAYAAITKKTDIYKTNHIGKHIGRALIGNFSVLMVFWTYSLMPMADATAFLFAAPLITTVFSALLLKESVGPLRWTAVLCGFGGVLLIAQPAGESYETYAVFIAISATCGTAFIGIFLRYLGRTEDALTTVFYFLFFGVLFTAPYMALYGHSPAGPTLPLLAGIGVAASLQLMLKTQAYRWAEASLLSTINYTSLLWATLFGWLFWNDLPSLPVIGGAAIVVTSNLFVVWREKQKAKHK